MLRLLIGLLVVAPVFGQTRAIIPATSAATGYPLSITTLNVTSADTTNLNALVMSGDRKDLLVIKNNGAATVNVTVNSVTDERGRTGTLGPTAVPGGAIVILGPFALSGWAQTNGKLNVEASTNNVSFAHIKLP